MPARRIGSGALAAFSALAVPIAAVQVPLGVYLPALYAKRLGIPLGLLGTIFLVEKLWGALADPLIGVLSDRGGGRLGRRRSWIAAGSVLFALSGVALFFPPPALAHAGWLGLWLFVFYLGWSMIQIPYFAWSGEISGDRHERTRIVAWQTFLSSAALILVLIVPTVIDQVRPGDAGLKLGAMGAFIVGSLIIALPLTLRALPEIAGDSDGSARPSALATIRIVAGDGPLMRVLAADFVVTTGQSVRGALFVFFVSDYMQLSRWASGLYLLQFVCSLAAAPLWLAIAGRAGKKQAMILGEIAQTAINLGLLAVVPGHPGVLLVLTAMQGVTMGSGNLMLRSMVADAAARHRAETGHDRTALYFSVFSVSMKAAMAVAIGGALPIVAWAGFSPTAAHNDPGALRVLLVVFAIGPALAHAASALIIRKFPGDDIPPARMRPSIANTPRRAS